MKTWSYILMGILIGLLATGAILLIAQPNRGAPITLLPAPTATATALPRPSVTPAPIQVLIKGQVVNPGTYSLEKNARLVDLIKLAGGLTQQADQNRVNQAFLLRDGDYFYIPAVDEKIPDTARNAPGNNPLDDPSFFEYPLDLNTATQEALESLPGIGPSKAAEIITYRVQNGAFVSVDDLLNVPGIGPAILETIQDYLIIEP